MYPGRRCRERNNKNGETSVRLLICAGGTGGGVYPALAVHSALRAIQPDVETLWVGGEGGMEAGLVERAGIPFKAIPAAGVHGVGIKRLPGNLLSLARGAQASGAILSGFRPDVLFFTGGYVAAPMALAGRKIPSLLYVPDVEPGLALKMLARFSQRITVTSEDSKQFFPGKANVVVTGYPTRAELSRWTRETAREKLGLQSDLPVLLVFGGSKGARSINMALLEHLSSLLGMVEIIHISGELDWDTVDAARQGLPEELSKRYHAY
ncbi:MAG: UDP-N-acetylglucosamine--N-acetylmuramyl-(pentapeptide) pyrophosphoryl-undecaprenol N-acetylglucosamine transferase, partial [Chloroflexi bacterium]